MKLTFICATALPSMISIVIFIMIMFGSPVKVYENLISYPLSILYGVAISILIPVGYGLFFCIIALVLFLPFQLVIRLFKGIRIKAWIETVDDKAVSIPNTEK